MFKRVGQMLVVNGSTAGAFRTDKLGPSVAYRMHESTTWAGQKNYKWKTMLVHNSYEKFTMDGNHLFEFAETVDDPERGVIELSPNFYMYAKFPIALDYMQAKSSRIELSVINQFPEITVWYPTKDDAVKACKEIINHQIRLVTKKHGEIVVVEKTF